MVAKNSGKESGIISGGGLNHPMKMVKMIQARCKICNPRGQGRRGWWEKCEHDPYFSIQEKPGSKEYKELEDGTIVKLDHPDVTYIKVPNWKQIADDPKVASGRMVRIQLERGSKFPEQLGFAPICDYFNCWESNPKVHATQVVQHEGIATVIGNYHTRDEAAIMTLRTRGTSIFLGIVSSYGGGVSDMERRREQLDSVNIQ